LIAESDISQSPSWFPLEAPGAVVRLVRLDETAYRTASFLDQRLLTSGFDQEMCASEIVRAAAAKLAPRSHYLFHTGHVGSTLVSRLIGAHESFFSVREPALLRTFSDGSTRHQGAPDLHAVLALLGRTWRSHQRAVIKATSFVSELAENILTTDDQAVAIFMFTGPLSYLRGILGGPNSRVEARHLAPGRLTRLTKRLGAAEGWRPDPRSEGQLIAMSWLCEMTALYQAGQPFRSRVRWVDFDGFLQDPAGMLHAVFQALGAGLPMNDIEKLVNGPLMRQYSKAPEYAYDAALRREVHHSADLEHSAEIRRAMDWLGRMAKQFPLVANVL
jgi:hypothetical protein